MDARLQHISTLAGAFFLCLAHAQAQGVSGDTIRVGGNAYVELVFLAPPEGKIPNGNGAYKLQGGAANSILISTRKTPPALQPLIINEGGREHKFVLVFDKDAGPGRHNYADLNKNQPKAEPFTAAKVDPQAVIPKANNVPPAQTDLPLSSPIEKSEVKTAMPADPRIAEHDRALANAEGLIAIGEYQLAVVELNRARLLNKKNSAAIDKRLAVVKKMGNSTTEEDEDEEETAKPGTPQWVYDSLILAGNRQFVARRYDSAMTSYRMAKQQAPDQSYPTSQLNAIDWELDQIWKNYVVSRTAVLSQQSKVQLAQKQYVEVLYSLHEMLQYKPKDEDYFRTQFNNVKRQLVILGKNPDSLLARVKLPDVWSVITQNNLAAPENTFKAEAAVVKSTLNEQVQATPAVGVEKKTAAPVSIDISPRPKPSIIGFSKQEESIPYQPDALAGKFPGIDFNSPPKEQQWNYADDPREHFLSIKRALDIHSSLQLADSAVNIKITCEGLFFSGLNAYIRLRVSNASEHDFLVGPMMLSWKQRSGRMVPLKPVSVSGFPVVQAGKEFSLVYVCRNLTISDDEYLFFSLKSRQAPTEWQITIPGKVYNTEKNQNQL